MKILVATDIHGSAYWAEQIVDKFNQSKADCLVLLGDIYNHGPRNPFPKDYAPAKVAEILNGIGSKVISVKGNCDSEVDQMISGFPFVSDEVIFTEKRRLYFTHGHIFNKTNLPMVSCGDVVLYGHFHISEIVDVDGVTCVNVGSCSLPKDGKNAYCLIDSNAVTVFDFDGNAIVQKRFDD